MIAEIQMWRSQLADACATGLRAVSRLPEGSVDWLIAAGLIITTSGQLSDNITVAEWIERTLPMQPVDDAARSAYVLALARGTTQLAWGDDTELAARAFASANRVAEACTLTPFAAARLEFARAYQWLLDGRVGDAIAQLDDVAARYAGIGARRDALQTSSIANMLAVFAGQYERGEAGLNAIVTEAGAMGATYIADWARFEIALSLAIRGEQDAAAREFDRCSDSVAKQPLFRVGRCIIDCWNALEKRDLATIEQEIAQIADVMPSRRYVGAMNAYRAFAQLVRGDTGGAREAAASALRELELAPGIFADMQLAGHAAALITLVESDAPGAANALAAHQARVRGLAEQFDDPEHRRQFLEVSWTRRVMSLRVATTHRA